MARMVGSPRAAERFGIAVALACAVLVFGFGAHPVIVLPVTFVGLTLFARIHGRTRAHRQR